MSVTINHASYVLTDKQWTTDGHTTGKHYTSAVYCWLGYNELTNSYRPTEKDSANKTCDNNYLTVELERE